ncbi:hypothetical protein HNQ07_000683 [Deinococcus metalli]|uniref:Uncharacterized protein n=1 Tax=Deinococcus metalli TaxID=1141878 RepID=A0A7W8KEV2_9DEIO|nr:hypothetical protein [Deinococcus metalli]MBB5375239.1 hypothetical protein [Deinococcus metalli]GHF30739.1 hypothetical protein GCM10017781_03580 [Deinococcus metalli]
MASLPVSALARPLDLRYSSNRVALVGAGVTLVLARRRGQSWGRALDAAGLAFLAWATARELDPDHPVTANAALPLGAVAGLAGLDTALPGLGALSGLRVLAGTTGEPPTVLDHAAMLAQTALTAATGSRSAALLPGLAAFVVRPTPTAAVPVLGASVPAWLARSGPTGSLGPLAAALALGPLLVRPERVTSECDRAPRQVRDQDVRRARIAAFAALSLGLTQRRAAGLVPLACAVLSVGVRRLRQP